MRLCSKLLLLLFFAFANCGDIDEFKDVDHGTHFMQAYREDNGIYDYERGPCLDTSKIAKRFMKTGTWRSGTWQMDRFRTTPMFWQREYFFKLYKKNTAVEGVFDLNNELVMYSNFLVDDERTICYRVDLYCGFIRRQDRDVKLKSFGECRSNDDCKAYGKRDEMLKCTAGVCCPDHSKMDSILAIPKSLKYRKNYLKDLKCDEGSYCENGPCAMVFGSRMRRYFSTQKENTFRCTEYDVPSDACPLDTKPLLLENRLHHPENFYCTDESELYNDNQGYCCPLLKGIFGGRNNPLVTDVDPNEIMECNKNCGYGDLSNKICANVARKDNVGGLRMKCVYVPYCKIAHNLYRVPTNIEDGKYIQSCKASSVISEVCGDQVSYCKPGAFCCPLDCPWLKNNRKEGANFYEVPEDGVCDKRGSHLFLSELLERKICCYVEDNLIINDQAPTSYEHDNADESITYNNDSLFYRIGDKSDRWPKVPFYTTYSMDFKATQIVHVCKRHSDCKSFAYTHCGYVKFHDSVDKHRIGNPSLCINTPELKNGETVIAVAATHEHIGLMACNKNSDCGAKSPVDCMPYKTAYKTGKFCFASQCPKFKKEVHGKDTAAVLKANFNCKDHSDCASDEADRTYDCFSTPIGRKHCCETTPICPGKLPFVPAKDGGHNADTAGCPEFSYKYGPLKDKVTYCCPTLRHSPSHRSIDSPDAVIYHIDLEITEDRYNTECNRASCDLTTHFCGDSERADGRPMPPEKKNSHCYKRPKCSGGYMSSLHRGSDIVIKCDELKDCAYHRDSIPRYCDKSIGICCEIEKTMCPYWTMQEKIYYMSNLAKCDGDCDTEGELCTDIPRMGKRCCYADSDKRCPHDQPPALIKFKTLDTRKCSEFHLYKYTTKSKIDVCCRHFQYAEIAEHLSPVQNDKAIAGQGGHEVTCKNHKNCRGSEFCGKAGYYKKEPHLAVKPAPEVYLCFPLPKHEGITAMKNTEENVGLQLCNSPKDCTGAKDAVACEKGVVVGKEGKEQTTKNKMCFQKKCPFGKKALQTTASCTANSDCSEDSACTPIGISKHCCPITNAAWCWGNHLPVPITSKGCDKDVSLMPHPNTDYKTVCCPKFQLSGYELKNGGRLYTTGASVCTRHSDCQGFCGVSTISTGTMRKSLKHCYPRPVYEEVGASLKSGNEEVQTCQTAKDCNANNPVVCEEGTIDKELVVGKKFCFEKACAFGDKPSEPSKTCTTSSDCDNEVCVKTFSTTSHCCRTGSNDITCPTGQPPVMGAGNDPHGKCDATAKSHAHKNKQYCCPGMAYKMPGTSIESYTAPPCLTKSDCKNNEFCGESSRLDSQSMRQSAKNCYKIPHCGMYSNNLHVALKNGEPSQCTGSNECLVVGETPHYCDNQMCCRFVECPYWTKVSMGDRLSLIPPNSKICEGKTVATAVRTSEDDVCCPVDEDKMCPGDQLPVMVDNKVPTQCPEDTVKHPAHSDICCRPLQSKDVKINNTPAKPQDDRKLCKSHKDCEEDEFCGYSEFATEKETLLGTPAHCYKTPLLNGISATLDRSIGVFKCSTASDCTGATQPVVCQIVEGEGFCFEKPCPFGAPAKNAEATCTDHKSCGSDSLCTSVHSSSKHCCHLGNDFLCHNLQVPYMQAESGECADGSEAHKTKPGVCCQPLIYKDLVEFGLSPYNNKECITHSECDQTQFCGDSTMKKMENRVHGNPKHCYRKPQNKEQLLASTNPSNNIMFCESDNECKTTHPSVCDDGSLDGKAIDRKMCFEKKCPFGGVTPTTLTTCESDSECLSGTLCTNVIGTKKHCCPVSDEFKCYGRQIPYMKPNATGCEDLSVRFNTLCCQRFIFKDFGESTALFAVNNDNECSVHKDCKEDEFCGESELYKMPGKAVGSPKHCYKKPEYEQGLALTNTDLGLVTCQDDVDCSSTNPVVCETLTIDGKAVTGNKYCFEKSCDGGTTRQPHHICKSHMECAKDEAVCEIVFGTRKYCCQPGKERRCYGNQLPYVKDGASKCEDGSVSLNGVCCQNFISKEVGIENPLYARKNEQECTSHAQCNGDEFCGYSTLEHMDGLVLGAPQHCFKAPTMEGAKSILKEPVGIIICNDASDCSFAATDAVVCEAVDKNDKVKFCFEKQCPYGEAPKDPTKTCSSDTDCSAAICTQVIGKVKHCCPVSNSLKCFNTQLPYEMDFSCEDGINHPHKDKKLCCRKFINKVLGDQNAVLPVNQEKECKSNADCANDHFCALSTVRNADNLLLGTPKHCYPKPLLDGSTPVFNSNGLISCEKVEDCETLNPSVCAEGKIAGKEIIGVKLCYEKPCPFGALSNASLQCSSASDCTDAVCYNVFSTVKHCCKSGSDFACHIDQDPYIKEGATECEDGSFVHPIKPDLCCQKFTYKLFNENPVFEPMALTSCNTKADCKDHEFCGESKLQKMGTKHKPKHCYPLPMLNAKQAMLDSNGELIPCKDDSSCPGTAVVTCSTPRVPSGELLGVSICYEAKCPLWDEEIDRSRTKDCSQQSDCGDYGSTQCLNLFGDKKCCPVAKKFLCPGGVPVVLDQDDYALDVCNSDLHYEKEIDNRGYCCAIPVSAGYASAAGIDVESKDGQTTCEKNADCDQGYFCGASMSKVEHIAFGNNLMHCYQEPSGVGGVIRKDDSNGITTCESHEDCKQDKGEYCNKELGKQYTKGICHLAKCPLAKALTGNFTSCTTNEDCGDMQCHPISERERGCCTVDDGNHCPGGLLPATVGQKSCAKEHFAFKANGVDVCCRRVISDTLKTAGSAWPLILSDSDEDVINAMDSNKCPCKDGFFCDKSAAMDRSTLEKELKLCFPVPQTHGNTVSGPPDEIKTCKNNIECDTVNGEICDLKIHEIEKNFNDETGVCSKFVCPLSQSSHAAKGSNFDVGLDLCTSTKECGPDKECQPVGKDEKYKACCGVDDEFVCPGGILPRKYKDKLYYTLNMITCDDNTEYPYEFGSYVTTPEATARCCPNVISRDIYLGSSEVDKKDMVYPSRQDKICQKHDDCEENEFCGESMLAENFKSGEPLVIKGAKVSHCYKKPKCSGTTVLYESVGLKVCNSSSTDACGDNEVCDFNLGDFNNNEFKNTGVCCHFNCKGSYIESKESGPWKAGKICDSCKEETKDQAFCDTYAKGDESSINICERTEVGNYRLCTYERDPVTCGADSAVRTIGIYDLLGCEHDIDCRIQRKDIDTHIRPRCLTPSRALPGLGHAKICCQADLCSDYFTVRQDQNECNVHDECSMRIGAYKKEAKCEEDILGKDKTKHCCPYAETSDDIDPDVAHPFRINKSCSSLADCVGYRRFCDPLTNQCMYNARRPRQPTPVKTCDIADKDCGDPREVCMTQLEENTDAQPECYFHPLDTCLTNKDCVDGHYCAPAPGTTEEAYTSAFRQCHKNPKSVATDPDYFGLFQCKTSADCKDSSKDICDASMTDVAVKPGYGFCKLKEEITCRGAPLLIYSKGKLHSCSNNADCKDTHYCDMDIKKPKGWTENQGICCSKPTDAAGDLPKIEVGLKICKDHSGCDAQQGEVCDTNIQKPEESTWAEDEGVCGKMNCPKITNPEVIPEELVPAGPICEVDNCQSDSGTIKSCVPSPNKITKLRCCSYKRNPSLCPADTKGPLRSGFDAVRCPVSTDCPKDAACFEGWCCKQDFCTDGFTLRAQQPICAETSVDTDCGQPTGASASCQDGHCCPINNDGVVEKPHVTKTECTSLSDCPRPLMYCHDELKKCVHFGKLPELQSNTPCAPGNNTCPDEQNLPGVCVLTSDAPGTVPFCFADPLAQKAPKAEALEATTVKAEETEEKSSTGMILGIVATVVAVVAMSGIGLFVFFKYRQNKKNVAKAEELKLKNTKKGDVKPAVPAKKYQTVSEVSMMSEVSQGSGVSGVSGKEPTNLPTIKEDNNSKLESDQPPNLNAPPMAPMVM